MSGFAINTVYLLVYSIYNTTYGPLFALVLICFDNWGIIMPLAVAVSQLQTGNHKRWGLSVTPISCCSWRTNCQSQNIWLFWTSVCWQTRWDSWRNMSRPTWYQNRPAGTTSMYNKYIRIKEAMTSANKSMDPPPSHAPQTSYIVSSGDTSARPLNSSD